VSDRNALDQSAEFQRRRAAWGALALGSAAIFLVGVLFITVLPGVVSWLAQALIWLGLAGMLASPLIANYRCPRCDRVPRGEEVVAFDPAVCRHCRARLK
jgi:hypothetical protein